MRRKVLGALTGVAWREYLRTPEAVFWTYGFPLVMALVLGFAFGEGEPAPARIGVVAAATDPLVVALREHGGDRLDVAVVGADRARRELTLGHYDLLVRGTPAVPFFDLDPKRPGSELARLLAERALMASLGRSSGIDAQIDEVDEAGDRYIDFLIAGLVGFNLLGAGLYGIGYQLVVMREKHLLRRLAATPLGRSEFLLSHLASRIVLALIPPIAIVAFGWFVFGVPVRGSFVALFGLVVLGAFTFSGIGLLVGSRTKSTETVSGLMNLVMMPMWLVGGVFFSNDRFPAIVRELVPMTHLTDALRGVMLGSLEPGQILTHAAVLALTGVCCFAVATRLFRWT